MNTCFKSLLVLLLTFVAGIAAGGVSCLIVIEQHPTFFSPPPGPEGAIRHLTELLRLSPKQQQQVRAIFLRNHQKLEEEFARARQFRVAFITGQFREMETILTPEQRAVAQKEQDRILSRPFPPPPPPLPSPE